MKYTCSACGAEYEDSLEDTAAAVREANQLWPRQEALAVVCDECFQLIRAWAKQRALWPQEPN